MSCEHCNGPGHDNEDPEVKCCWTVAKEIGDYKKRIFRHYILEVLFDMSISMASVIADIVTLVFYGLRQKWWLTAVTLFPVLLPTLVFTNVYMADENSAKSAKTEPPVEKTEETGFGARILNFIERRTRVTKVGPINIFACFSGLFHFLFHKDRNIRRRGGKIFRKSLRRTAKYFFGTLVLRFIAWAWYLKALFFGLKAMKEPKKYMKIEQPDAHWSRELLVRLDFFQASLENAPQCVIQLYVLLTDSHENKVLGTMTLIFAFIDFVRVATTVLWNVNKGPVLAPTNCYGTLIWQVMNISSWIFLYVARCASISLIMVIVVWTQNGIIAIPIMIAILHCTIFSVLVSRLKLGTAQTLLQQKLAVTTFISIFFLPDLDSRNPVHAVVQFYYGMILLENTLFIVPWGWDLSYTGFCYSVPLITSTTTTTTTEAGLFLDSSSSTSSCFVDPVVVAILVPTLTMIGVVFRLAASKKMTDFNKLNGQSHQAGKSMTMEERVAHIYRKKWTNMTVREMWAAFMRMLRKEVILKSHNSEQKNKDNKLGVISNEFQRQLMNSQDYIRKSFSHVASHVPQNLNSVGNSKNKKSTIPREYFSQYLYGGPTFQNLNVRFLKVETENGVHVFETAQL